MVVCGLERLQDGSYSLASDLINLMRNTHTHTHTPLQCAPSSKYYFSMNRFYHVSDLQKKDPELVMRNVPLIAGAGNEAHYGLQRERVLKCGTGVNALVRLFNGFYSLV